MIEVEVTHLTQTAKALYGVYSVQGADVETITILVNFIADTTAQLLSLLRIGSAEDCSIRAKLVGLVRVSPSPWTILGRMAPSSFKPLNHPQYQV